MKIDVNESYYGIIYFFFTHTYGDDIFLFRISSASKIDLEWIDVPTTQPCVSGETVIRSESTRKKEKKGEKSCPSWHGRFFGNDTQFRQITACSMQSNISDVLPLRRIEDETRGKKKAIAVRAARSERLTVDGNIVDGVAVNGIFITNSLAAIKHHCDWPLTSRVTTTIYLSYFGHTVVAKSAYLCTLFTSRCEPHRVLHR